MALHSSLDMLALDGLACLRTLSMSALNSSASVGLRLWHATSITVIYSSYGGSYESQQSLDHVIALFPVPQIGGCWINLHPIAC